MSHAYSAATAQADRLESQERDADLARSIAREIVAEQTRAAQAVAAAAVAPIRRADFDKLSPADRTNLIRSGRKLID